MTVDVECYDTSENAWAQATFLIHGMGDVYWTNDPKDAAEYVLQDLIKFKEQLEAPEYEEPCEKFSGVFQF